MTLLEKSVWGSKSGAVALTALALFSSAPVWAQARLSPSVQRHVDAKSAQAIDVIVHGSSDEIRSIARRRGLRLKKLLIEGAVFQTTAADIEALSADVDHLSADTEVTSFMSVTNAAIGADQVTSTPIRFRANG